MSRLPAAVVRSPPVAAALAVALAACCAPGDDDRRPAAGDSGPIKIAVVDAQSGQLSSLGAWELKGAKLAVDEWNKAGGINGRQIQLDVFDDQGDPTVGTNLARKIDSEGYIAMIGTAESAVTIAMAPDPAAGARSRTSPPASRPAWSRSKSPFLFLNGPTSTTYDETLAKYIVDTKGIKSIAMITNNGSLRQGRARRVPQGAADPRASRRSPTRSSPPTRRTSAPRSPRSGRRSRS